MRSFRKKCHATVGPLSRQLMQVEEDERQNWRAFKEAREAYQELCLEDGISDARLVAALRKRDAARNLWQESHDRIYALRNNIKSAELALLG